MRDYGEEYDYFFEEESDTELVENAYDAAEFNQSSDENPKICFLCKQEPIKKCNRCGRCGTHAAIPNYCLQGCMHEVCRECLLGYLVYNEKLKHVLAYNVNEEKFSGLACPISECRRMLSRQDLRVAMGEHVLEDLDAEALKQVFKGGSPYTRISKTVMDMKEAYNKLRSARNLDKSQEEQQLIEAVIKSFKTLNEGISQVRDEDTYLLEVVVCYDPTVHAVLFWLLSNHLTFDISKHFDLYTEMFNFLKITTGKPQLYPLLHQLDDNNDCWMLDLVTTDQESLMSLFEKLLKQTTVELESSTSVTAKEEEFLFKSKEVYETLVEHVQIWKAEFAIHPWYKDAHKYFTERWDGIMPELGKASESGSSRSRAIIMLNYVWSLRSKQFGEAKLQQNHYFREIVKDIVNSETRSRRVAREIAALATSLPLELSSSIHVRVDTDRRDVIKALIIGPEGTPYENGIFLFDIFLPSKYPEMPPKVRFLKTHGGNVQFNPNLDGNGRVYLSLLGTWSGPGWIPGESTLLQVLVSIQSLVLVAEPYYNEPGRVFIPDNEESEKYNRLQRNNTLLYSILPALRKPEPAFADVIMVHFQLKRKMIEKQCDRWMCPRNIAESIKSELAVKFDNQH